MTAWVERLEAHHLGGAREGGVCRVLVARFPVVDLVVGLAFLLVADDDRTRRDRLLWGRDRLQRLVVDAHQCCSILGDVLGLSDDAGDLLSLEADLVSREHRLRVAGECRHPRELVLGKQLARDDRDHSGNRHGGAGVNALDACVGMRTAHDDHVEHAREDDVIDVVTLAVNEPRVLLAGERDADASHRLTRGFSRCSRFFGVDCHHATPAVSAVFAAAAC